ncbi:hypothetical protein LWI28_014136 [Acer negundo]|uniref:Uncharacterized protein n=1 Tax=Acer negundo TaxID=4023 RepID=A0AAD5JAL9_ACENE|nr:hypothetical protein LWI28_014136 [Acer negundo]
MGLTVSRALSLAIMWALCLIANICIRRFADQMFGGSRTFIPGGIWVKCLAVLFDFREPMALYIHVWEHVSNNKKGL